MEERTMKNEEMHIRQDQYPDATMNSLSEVPSL